jgi:hypothetical protein
MKAHHRALEDYAPLFEAYLVTYEAHLVAVSLRPGALEATATVTLE